MIRIKSRKAIERLPDSANRQQQQQKQQAAVPAGGMGVPMSFVLVLASICLSHCLELQNALDSFKRSQEHVVSEPTDCVSRSRMPVSANPHNFSVDIRMPAVVPAASDTYLCTAFSVPTSQDAYIGEYIFFKIY
ncbi:hypothetical protein PBY51_023941 [Eleginops maclovinus]|uniref:Uncharacterized protein n=1 Tax=Eleginops maclovinus TaxID=56733 RepID=A0AAN8A4B0_ELEMC|nr:hypothetical protein PBY51_023941 [Eleginops maclovinus]